MAGTYQQQRGQDRNATSLLAPSLCPAALVCPQSQVGREFPIDWLYGPAALIGTDPLSRHPFVQMGPQDFCLFWAGVTPSLTPYHGDGTDVPPAQACALDPEGVAAPGAGQARPPDALILLARHRRSQVFDRFILHRFPGPGHGAHQAPPPRRSGGVTL
jgi:hypothetical protein